MASVRALVASREGSVKKLIVRIPHARITASVLKEFAFARRVGRVWIVLSKTRQQFLVCQPAQITESLIRTPRNAFAKKNLAATIAPWNFAI